MSVKQYAIANDIHLGFESRPAWRKFIDHMTKFPDLGGIYLNGDIGEFSSVSAHPKSPSANIMLLDELDYINKKLDELQKLFNVPVFYICGNHEHRIFRYVRDIAPQMYGLAECPKLLNFDKRPGWKFIPYEPRQLVKVGKTSDLYCRHEPVGSSGPNCMRATAEKSVVSIIFGHVHIEGSYSVKKFGPRPHTVHAYANGWMGDIKSDCFHYRGPNDNWQLGFSRIDCDEKSGEWERKFIRL